MMQSKYTQRGFTLLEILLSLMVFAMLGMATYSVINSTIRGNEAVTQQNQTLTSLQRAFTILESDIVQLAQRQIRLDGEQPVKAYFRSGEYMFDSDGIGFGFVRDGWVNPKMILPRSELQAVAYRLKDNVLQRLYFNYVDNEMGAEPRIQELLTGVNAISLEYSVNDEWVEELGEDSVPVMVKIGFETQTYGLVERILPIIAVTDKPKQT
ncbi:MAG: type II secretion system minor pseudopilin GspJ [Gammaproteobacteria bacterium]|nr:type II secretion system minor pseudopilin GspJ [Gammaproteobacteria bacterium]